MPTLKDELKTLREEFGKRMTDVEKVIEDQLGTRPNEREDKGKGSAQGARDDDDGDDPRDTGRPSIFGEEKDRACQKFALLVGINAYPPPDGLGGCVNDVVNMRQKLQAEFNVPAGNIKTLTDANATKANILGELAIFVDKLRQHHGSAGLFHFSGHGTQTIDKDPLDEPDFLDEVIVPVDLKYLRDDEIAGVLRGVSPAKTNLCVVLDSCHSGTGIRSPAAKGRSFGIDKNERDLALFLEFLTWVAANGGLQFVPSVRSGPPPVAGGHTLLAAASANETALDVRTAGLFTRELLPNMRAGRTYKQAFDPTAASVTRLARQIIPGHRQTPQLENGTRAIMECFD